MTAQEIFDIHLTALKVGIIKPETVSPKFTSKEEVKAYLESGEILPALMIKAIDHTQSVSQQIWIYGIGKLNPKQEKQIKSTIITALKDLDIL